LTDDLKSLFALVSSLLSWFEDLFQFLIHVQGELFLSVLTLTLVRVLNPYFSDRLDSQITRFFTDWPISQSILISLANAFAPAQPVLPVNFHTHPHSTFS